MRVLLTTDTIGGVWTFTQELTTQLLERGHEIALVSFGRAPNGGQKRTCKCLAKTYGDAFRYEWSDTPLEWMQQNQHAYEAGEPLLQEVAESFSPDILHSSQFCFGRLAVETPRVITAHSDVLSWAEACKPKGLESSAWLTRYVALVRDGLAAADAVVAPTKWMLSALSRNFAAPRHTSVIANGRTLPAFHGTAEQNPSERKLQAVSAGRLWDEAKNLALLTRVHSPFPVVIAGEQQHEAAAAPEGSASLKLLGPMEEKELFHLFRTSSVYLAPSIYEPFGLAPLEAALCGCAVVANDIPSLREVWGDAAQYFQNEASLENLLQNLCDSPELLTAARQASFQRAQQLSASRMAAGYLSLYEELLRPTHHQPAYELTGHAS